MPEIIERVVILVLLSHLYKVKKGNKSNTFKDDDAMDEYSMSIALMVQRFTSVNMPSYAWCTIRKTGCRLPCCA